jgi:hypothetical protein
MALTDATGGGAKFQEFHMTHSAAFSNKRKEQSLLLILTRNGC